jgi:hypothetical protein
MRYELKSIPVWPVTKVAFFVNLVVGFVLGLLLAVFMMPVVTTLATMAAYDAGELDFDSGPIGALTFIIPFMMAVWSAFFNTAIVVIIAVAYNLVVKVVGGIELSLGPVDLPSLVSEFASQAAESKPEPPVEESRSVPPPPPVTDRPIPPPPVITQPEPRPPETGPSVPPDEPTDTGESDDRNINE